jgi:PAS domain S-box-containing protein
MLFEIFVAALSILLFLNMWIFSIIMGRRPLMIKAGLIMLPMTSVACLVEIIQLYSDNLEVKTILYYVSSMLFIVVFTCFLFMALEITQRFDPFKTKIFLPLMIVPSLAAFAILTDPWLHFFTSSQSLTDGHSMLDPILIVGPSFMGYIWIAYFDIVGSAFAFYLFLYVYRDGSKGLAFAFLGGVVLIHSYIIASYFFQDLNAVYPGNLGYAISAAAIYLYSFKFGVFDLAPASKEKMLDVIQDNIITVDSRGRVTIVNHACQRYLGDQAKGVIGKSFSEVFTSFPYFKGLPYLNDIKDLPPEVVDPSGRSFEVNVEVYRIGYTATLGNLIVLHELTERKKIEELMRKAEAQEKLAESERKYRMVVDNQTEAIISFRPDGKVTFANKVIEQYLDQVGIPFSELNVYKFPNFWDSRGLNKFITSMTLENPVGEYEHVLLRPNGRTQNILWRAKGMFDEEGVLQEVQAVGIDITERQRLEQEMARNQKLESLGVLAGGIAHDFNNMLASIVSNTEIAILDHPEDEKHVHRLQESVRSAMRARNLTQQLLTFSKGGQPVKEVVDLKVLVPSTVEFVLAGSQLVPTVDIDSGLRMISADPIQIEQVINNLIINAMQAMPNGGNLSIRMKNLETESESGLGDNHPRVCIEIKDEGSGIPQEHLDKIFDPFFTTKATGTGLGLSTVRSIVRNHGGTVTVESMLGVGTKFTVVLPATEDNAEQSSQMHKVETAGHGRILVMDDEESILDVLQMMLENFGYKVEGVRTGEEAIKTYQERFSSGRPFNAVIMDLTIRGGMGGKEAIQGIRSIDPYAKVIVSSGYSNDPIMAHPQEYGFADVLQKPFTMQDLSAKIEAVLAKDGDRTSAVKAETPLTDEATR